MMLQLEQLSVYLAQGKTGEVPVLDRVSLTLEAGEALGIVGESGCGKSMTALSLMRLIPSPPLRRTEGRILWQGRDLLQLSARDMREIRGNQIAMIFQEPMTALNPVMRVGEQIREVLRQHRASSRAEEQRRILELLEKVGIPDPAERAQAYPHQLSGGMRQRIMIAMAMACHPQLLIADEPTTALDVTIQAQILAQLQALRRELGMGLLFISHDLNVVGYLTDRILVMYAGEIVEEAPATELLNAPAHPYTKALQRSRPQPERAEPLVPIPGQVPALGHWPTGCRFYERCPQRKEECAVQPPPLVSLNPRHQVRCWLFTSSHFQ